MLPLTSILTPVVFVGSSPSSFSFLFERSVVSWLATATLCSAPGTKTHVATVNGLAASKRPGAGRLSVDLPENCKDGALGSGPSPAVTPAGRFAGVDVMANASELGSIG